MEYNDLTDFNAEYVYSPGADWDWCLTDIEIKVTDAIALKWNIKFEPTNMDTRNNRSIYE